MSRPQNIRTILSIATDGQATEVVGWLKSKRASKAFAFIVINDGSQQADLQIVLGEDSPSWANLAAFTTGSAVRATGQIKASQGKGQQWEVHASQIELIGPADAEAYPLQKKGHTLEFLREISHLRPRTNTFGAVFRVRNVLSQLVHQFFQERGFVWVHTPIITASDCEGAGEMFRVTNFDIEHPPRENGKIDYKQDFFGKAAHLTVSGQLEGEAFAQCMRDIYTFGPTFRAENSNTSRHLAEFWMIEPEMAFADLNDDMDLAEGFLKYLFRNIVLQCEPELQFLEQHYKASKVSDLSALAESKFTRITYTDAVKALIESKQSFEFPIKWGTDLQSEHERYLTDHICKGPTIVTDYPEEFKAFYMRLNDDGKTVRAMDVLVPRVGEIIGGSQREERLDVLQERMRAKGVAAEDLWWYLDLRRYGSTPHCGFGAGFERLVQYVTGMGNIRDVIPFARHPGQIGF